MFDDPQKELKRLEEQLLKTETDDDFEQFYQDIFEEFGTPEEVQPAPKRVNPAPKAKVSTYADTPRAVAPPKQDKSIRNLGIVIFAECLGIAAVALWWVLRLL